MKLKIISFLLSVFAVMASASVQAQQINIICSVQAEWCNMILTWRLKTDPI
jgi:hypothetical protein